MSRRYLQRSKPIDASDLLTFEDEVAAHVAASVDAHLQVIESRRAAASSDPTDAHGLLMQAIPLVCRLDQFSLAKASSLLDQAVALDAQNVSVRVGLAQFHMVMASQGWARNPGEALQRAEEEAMIARSGPIRGAPSASRAMSDHSVAGSRAMLSICIDKRCN